MYEYKAELVRVVDGDTVDLMVSLGFNTYQKTRFRLAGIDTPEVRGVERPQGLDAKAYVEAALGHDFAEPLALVVRTNKTGKYGRWIADIFVPLPGFDPNDRGVKRAFTVVNNVSMVHLNKLLVEHGHAEVVSW